MDEVDFNGENYVIGLYIDKGLETLDQITDFVLEKARIIKTYNKAVQVEFVLYCFTDGWYSHLREEIIKEGCLVKTVEIDLKEPSNYTEAIASDVISILVQEGGLEFMVITESSKISYYANIIALGDFSGINTDVIGITKS